MVFHLFFTFWSLSTWLLFGATPISPFSSFRLVGSCGFWCLPNSLLSHDAQQQMQMCVFLSFQFNPGGQFLNIYFLKLVSSSLSITFSCIWGIKSTAKTATIFKLAVTVNKGLGTNSGNWTKRYIWIHFNWHITLTITTYWSTQFISG